MASELTVGSISPSKGIIIPSAQATKNNSSGGGNILLEDNELKYYVDNVGWVSVGRKKEIIKSSLVANYDFGNFACFRGIPTTNNGNAVRNYTGTSYAQLAEWETTTLQKTYEPLVETPIGVGCTRIDESTVSGFQALSRWGGGGETGAHFLSAFVYPLNSNTTTYRIGLLADTGNTITLNVSTGNISYSGGISNRSAFIESLKDYPGWYRIGANFEGRSGGWVGCIGYSVSSYAGVSGSLKSSYITGIQYELSDKVSPYYGFDGPPNQTRNRASTVNTFGGIHDISGNNRDGEIFGNFNFDRIDSQSLMFNGSDTRLDFGSFFTFPTFTISLWVKPGSTQVQFADIFDNNHTGSRNFVLQQNSTTLNQYSFSCINSSGSSTTGNFNLLSNVWTNLTFTWNNSRVKGYKDGIVFATGANTNPINYDAPNFRIGGWYAGGRNWNGKMGEFLIYNRELSDQEILYNFNITRSRYGI